ncbi:MAG: GAF domain-containing protein [Anaerolineales bacterium]|nr:GAF domain-containing protein [Anaerolineales bacterium]
MDHNRQDSRTLPLGEIYGDASRIAIVFYGFITLIIIGLTVGVFIVYATGNWLGAIFLFASIPPVVATYLLVQRQKFEAAAIFISVVLTVLNTLLATNGLGLHHISILAFPAILIVASLVTKTRSMIFLTLLIIAAMAWLVFGDLYSLYTPAVRTRSLLGDFLSAVTITLLTAMMVRFLSETLFQSYRQLRKELADKHSAEQQREALIKELEAKNAESETLRESLAVMIGTLKFEEIIQNILDQIVRVVPYDSASIWRVDGNLQKLIGGRNLPDLEATGDTVMVTDDNNSALPILRGEVPFILNNNVQEELPDFQTPPHTYVQSWLAIPLKTRGRILGIIALDGIRKGQFNEHHAEVAVAFANQVAIALENSLLFNDLQNELRTSSQLIQKLEFKNAELERFTYTVSHDLKSPLVTINGFLGYLETDVATNNMARFKHDSERIRDAVKRMHTLLGELLELSRIGRIVNPSQTIAFGDLVQEALEIVHGQLTQHNVRVTVEPDLPDVYGDRQRLTEVLQNLIDNAARFMGEQPNPQIVIGCEGEDNGLPVFFVRDNGIGIPHDLHGRIFGLFDKLDPSSEGTGVGLAIVKRIVEVHGGRIWVESEAGMGATFYFSLPANESQFPI